MAIWTRRTRQLQFVPRIMGHWYLAYLCYVLCCSLWYLVTLQKFVKAMWFLPVCKELKTRQSLSRHGYNNIIYSVEYLTQCNVTAWKIIWYTSVYYASYFFLPSPSPSNYNPISSTSSVHSFGRDSAVAAIFSHPGGCGTVLIGSICLFTIRIRSVGMQNRLRASMIQVRFRLG